MLSRVAESVYWMSRQVERSENLARFLEVTLNLILDQPENLVDPWEPLVRVTGDTKWFIDKYGPPNVHNVVRFLAFDWEYHSSMLTCLRAARENAPRCARCPVYRSLRTTQRVLPFRQRFNRVSDYGSDGPSSSTRFASTH